MRLAVPMRLVAKFLAAFLVLLGTSGQGLAAMLCGSASCPKTQVAKPVPVEKESCCAKAKAKPEPESKKDCCCEVKSFPKAAKPEAKFVVPAGPEFDLALPEPPVKIPEQRSVREPQVPIPSVTDASPPDPARQPDRGRAPPVA
jgi:hypothetical protein